MQPNTVSSPLSSLITPEKVDPQTHTMGLIVETDLSSSVTCVGGILLTKHQCLSTGAIVSDVYSCYMHRIPLLRFRCFDNRLKFDLFMQLFLKIISASNSVFGSVRKTYRTNSYTEAWHWEHRTIKQSIWFYNDMSHIMRKPVYATCEQQRCRSACASVQSDQHLCYSLLR